MTPNCNVSVPPLEAEKSPVPEKAGEVLFREIASDFDRLKEWTQFLRAEGTRNVVAVGLRRLMSVVIYLVIIAVVALSWHYVFPAWLGWLTESQINSLQTFLFSGAVTGSVLGYFRQHT